MQGSQKFRTNGRITLVHGINLTAARGYLYTPKTILCQKLFKKMKIHRKLLEFVDFASFSACLSCATALLGITIIIIIHAPLAKLSSNPSFFRRRRSSFSASEARSYAHTHKKLLWMRVCVFFLFSILFLFHFFLIFILASGGESSHPLTLKAGVERERENQV